MDVELLRQRECFLLVCALHLLVTAVAFVDDIIEKLGKHVVALFVPGNTAHSHNEGVPRIINSCSAT